MGEGIYSRIIGDGNKTQVVGNPVDRDLSLTRIKCQITFLGILVCSIVGLTVVEGGRERSGLLLGMNVLVENLQRRKR